ncbi:MAG TPA: cysteine desulfurase-like protein [Thermoanaerobaculia bacterium]|nr:cysteine desulfurase-like protein [Thermoanaerobaculia bacterium]
MPESTLPAIHDVAATSEIRGHFPALDRIHNGQPVAYFDAPGGTQVPRAVAEGVTDYLLRHNANTHWAYPTSEETDAILDDARRVTAEFLNARIEEIVFGANMTTLTLHLARALGRTWAAGDEVIVTELDHHGNVDPWRALERDYGTVIRTARMIPATAQIDLDHLAQLVRPRTRLIAVGGASNATGTVNDLAHIGALARSMKALFFVDAVHLAPHQLIDVQKIDCDFLACSAYKFYGPHAGILFGRQRLIETLPFPRLAPAPDTAPERAESGTQNHEAIAGIRATIDFLASLGGEDGSRRERLGRVFAELHERGMELTRTLWRGLASMPRVRLYGPPPEMPRTPTVSFTIDGLPSEQIARALAAGALFASHGDFYALTAVERLGATDGLLRIGCACYTTAEEITRLLDAVERIAD